MNHKGTKTLETERLILRKFIESDLDSIYKNWSSDDEVTKFLTWTTHKNIDDSKIFLNSCFERYKTEDNYIWAIELKETGEVIGSISVPAVKESVKEVALGYCLGTKWWRRGIMTEAGQAVIKYLFEGIGVERISAVYAKDNFKSRMVMLKLGMKYEGTLRRAVLCNSGIVDIVCYALLRCEYDDYVKNNNFGYGNEN